MKISSSRHELKAAAATFAVNSVVGQAADFSMTGKMIERVIGDLRTTVILVTHGDVKFCLASSPFPIDARPALRNATKRVLAEQLGLAQSDVVCASTHDHTVPQMRIGEAGPADPETNQLGKDYLAGLTAAASGLGAKLTPVTVKWGVGQESRFTYNRRGRRADGTSYFIREEDRQLLGQDYVGEIDPDAPVVILADAAGRAIGAIVLFTGHPVTAYNPEVPMSFGQWPQVACEKLAAYLAAPVAFLQGCAGDINSKFMLTGTAEQAIQMGQQLGDTFIRAAQSAQPSQTNGLQWTRVTAPIPCAPLPSVESLKASLAEIDGFVKRAEAGDEDTMTCVGMNFPRALSPVYRARLVGSVRPWYVWALSQHEAGKADQVAKAWPQEIVVVRLGDVGIVGFKFEAYVRTGLKLKREAPLPLVLTGCYMDGGEGYIPDAAACDDREYQSGHFRYMGDRPPYQAPGGDAAATTAVETFRKMLAAEPA